MSVCSQETTSLRARGGRQSLWTQTEQEVCAGDEPATAWAAQAPSTRPENRGTTRSRPPPPASTRELRELLPWEAEAGVCTHVCTRSTHTCADTCTHTLHTCTDMHTHVHMCRHVHTHSAHMRTHAFYMHAQSTHAHSTHTCTFYTHAHTLNTFTHSAHVPADTCTRAFYMHSTHVRAHMYISSTHILHTCTHILHTFYILHTHAHTHSTRTHILHTYVLQTFYTYACTRTHTYTSLS